MHSPLQRNVVFQIDIFSNLLTVCKLPAKSISIPYSVNENRFTYYILYKKLSIKCSENVNIFATAVYICKKHFKFDRLVWS